MMEQLQMDLSIVKKEPHYFEDYGQSAGNILDNIIPEPDFDQFGHSASSVPNSEDMDQGVDWLSSFFDEPSHDTCNVNGLNPPISKLSDIPLNTSAYPSVVKLLGSNTQILSDTLSFMSDEYTNDMVYKSPNSVRPPSPDPFLGPSQDLGTTAATIKQPTDLDLASALKKAQNFKILSQVDRHTLNLATAKELIQRLKDAQHNNSFDRLREQRLGHKQIQNQKVRTDIGNGLFNSVVKTEAETNGSDSGYESPSQLSPGRIPSPLAGPLGEHSNSSTENSPTCIQSKERASFYLSEEERRTLITEGLPIPSGLPLSKLEERALKKVRRKIKNKISAQESRRKKKEYMEALEKKIEIVNGDNSDLRKKVDTLDTANRSLLVQLQKLQAAVSGKSSRDNKAKSTQTTQSVTHS